MPGTKDLRDKLEEWGYHATARTTRKITRVRRVGNIITFEIPDALAYNQMKNDKEIVEKALTEAGLPLRLAPPHLVMQSAVSVALCGEDLARAGKLVSAQELLPVYLRPPQAQRLRDRLQT